MSASDNGMGVEPRGEGRGTGDGKGGGGERAGRLASSCTHLLGEEIFPRAPAKMVEHRQDNVLLDTPQPHADLGLLHWVSTAQLFAAAVVCQKRYANLPV